MAPVEPVIVEYCVKLSRIGQPLTREEAVALAISLITGTELENTVIAWKKKFSKYKDGDPLLGVSWCRGFIGGESQTKGRLSTEAEETRAGVSVAEA
jgi:hypothetical protein